MLSVNYAALSLNMDPEGNRYGEYQGSMVFGVHRLFSYSGPT